MSFEIRGPGEVHHRCGGEIRCCAPTKRRRGCARSVKSQHHETHRWQCLRCGRRVTRHEIDGWPTQRLKLVAWSCAAVGEIPPEMSEATLLASKYAAHFPIRRDYLRRLPGKRARCGCGAKIVQRELR